MWTRQAGLRPAVILLCLLAAGCAQPGTRDGDSSPLPSSSSSLPSSSSSLPSSSSSLPSPSAVIASPAEAAQAAPPGDGAPHEAENNGWKRRPDLTADQQRAGDALAARIRPRLAALRATGDFAPESTRQTLLGLGLRSEDVQVTAMRTPLDAATPPPGAVFAARFGGTGCVLGDVRPDRLLVEVAAAGAEFGCPEPYTH
jgi:hypothetical protein